MKIANQAMVVTGANRGIGRAFAMMCAKQNARLHLVVRTQDKELVAALKSAGALDIRVWICDLSTRQGVDGLVAGLKHERIAILFNNAGQLTGGLLEEQPLDDIYSMIQVKVNALIHLTHALLPAMIERGHGKIINNSSVSAIMHFPCASTYAASKAAVLAFSNCLCAELKGTGVSTLCLITPGIKTRMFDAIDEKYGRNLELPLSSISAEAYAEQIREAIDRDVETLEPRCRISSECTRRFPDGVPAGVA